MTRLALLFALLPALAFAQDRLDPENIAVNVAVDNLTAGGEYCGEVTFDFTVPDSGMHGKLSAYWGSGSAIVRPYIMVLTSANEWVPIAAGMSRARFYTLASDLPAGYDAVAVVALYSRTSAASIPLRLQFDSDVEVTDFRQSERPVSCSQ